MDEPKQLEGRGVPGGGTEGIDPCHAIGGSEISPYVADWIPADGGPGASYVGEQLCLPPHTGTQQLAFAPIAEGLGLFAHQGVWHRPGTIRGWIELPEPYVEIRLPLAGTTRILTASGVVIDETPQRATLNIEPPGAPCEHHNLAGEFNSRLAVLITASHLRGLFGEDPPGERLRFINDPLSWPIVNAEIPMTRTLRRLSGDILHRQMPEPLARLFLAAKTVEVLSHVLASFIGDAAAGETAARLSERDRRRGQRATDLLMANLETPPPVHELARSLGLSQRRLNAIFRELHGGTVLECLARWRMSLARELLRGDTLSIKEIAFRLGYDHCNNFISAFQRQVGISPGKFRARALGKGGGGRLPF